MNSHELELIQQLEDADVYREYLLALVKLSGMRYVLWQDKVTFVGCAILGLDIECIGSVEDQMQYIKGDIHENECELLAQKKAKEKRKADKKIKALMPVKPKAKGKKK